jgi:hypothetical protein
VYQHSDSRRRQKLTNDRALLLAIFSFSHDNAAARGRICENIGVKLSVFTISFLEIVSTFERPSLFVERSFDFGS